MIDGLPWEISGFCSKDGRPSLSFWLICTNNYYQNDMLTCGAVLLLKFILLWCKGQTAFYKKKLKFVSFLFLLQTGHSAEDLSADVPPQQRAGGLSANGRCAGGPSAPVSAPICASCQTVIVVLTNKCKEAGSVFFSVSIYLSNDDMEKKVITFKL